MAAAAQSAPAVEASWAADVIDHDDDVSEQEADDSMYLDMQGNPVKKGMSWSPQA